MKIIKAIQAKRAGKGDFVLSVAAKEHICGAATHQPQVQLEMSMEDA
jgi:hypothetical protein